MARTAGALKRARSKARAHAPPGGTAPAPLMSGATEPESGNVQHIFRRYAETKDRRLRDEIVARNRGLADFKRVGGYLLWEKDFPRTASLKIKRGELAAEIGKSASRKSIVEI